ncbi:hypothetical protein HID58_028386 [Brassica napus]|uniref:TOD1/MUCI70 glycosyltransferase-like domain-containing protein n=1 Tax=Brassica napus TaxID=3708 RepID=A0ABQ8CA23_BRANA|nr:hypothetical protein HID58_028386 [Brassica napus]
MLTSNSKDKERSLSFLCCWYLGRRRVAMLLLLSLAFVVFVLGSYTINKESSNSPNIHQSIETIEFGINQTPLSRELSSFYTGDSNNDQTTRGSDVDIIHPPPSLPSHHPCDSFSFPPPPPPGLRRPGPRRQGGSEFGGYPSLEDRTNSFDIKESMTVHCGFVKGTKPGHQTGFDIDEDILPEMDQFHEVIVASAIFGKYDLIQEPVNISEMARKNIPFYMFVDEETHSYLKNTSSYTEDNKRVGLWRIIVAHNVPYTDARRNGKVRNSVLKIILGARLGG